LSNLEKIAKKEELCRQFRDWTDAKATGEKDYWLVPLKIEANYCRNCSDRISEGGQYYCLQRKI